MDTTIDRSNLVGNVDRTHIQKAPVDAAMKLVDENSNRVQVIIRNAGSTTVFLGKDEDVTTSNGFPLQSGEQLTDNTSSAAYWGITAGDAADLRIIQVP